MSLLGRFEERAGRPVADVRALVVSISRVPYGRNREPTPLAVVEDWRGTCSTKHLLLVELLGERWPDMGVRLFHRPYVVTRELASATWGGRVAAVVPAKGLTDVHTFARLELEGRWTEVDVTTALAEWDGTSPTPLRCGPGPDVPAGSDPLAVKRALQARHCDASVRETFIAALAAEDLRTRARA